MPERVVMISRPATPEEQEVIERKGGLRLNSNMKDGIIKKALAHAFDKRQKALLDEELEISRLFWLEAFGPTKLKHAKALGEPFVSIDTTLYGDKEPDGVSINWRVGSYTMGLRTHMPLPTHVSGTMLKFFKVKDQKLIDRAVAWQDDVKAHRDEHAKVHNTLLAMLQSISTYTSLEKNWPEGKPFYKHIPKDYPYRHQVPAVQVAELNKALGI